MPIRAYLDDRKFEPDTMRPMGLAFEMARAAVRTADGTAPRHFAPRVWAASIFAHVAMRPDKARPLLPVIRRFPGLLTLGARLSGKTTQVVAAA
jgi:hypothetical protein